jgi:hypothetical protein
VADELTVSTSIELPAPAAIRGNAAGSGADGQQPIASNLLVRLILPGLQASPGAVADICPNQGWALLVAVQRRPRDHHLNDDLGARLP